MASILHPLLGDRSPGLIHHSLLSFPEEETLVARWRRVVGNFLNSRWGHYLILLLVTIDVCCSFSVFLIQLHVCELKLNGYLVDHGWGIAEEALGVAGLVISCLFMVELIMVTFSFGTGYFSTWFHIFDSLVILVAFVISISFQGFEEELGSLVVVLRLWRVFQIIEELKSASEDTLGLYQQEIDRLREENSSLRQRLNVVVDGNDGIA
ncbi:hypothetical protein N7462_006536 [Penicillium macrosclerotiorum]|uniref:uncharacterized protein n=1 Tax=Penicillium macrosclerotiorum TaxID=303699 RepID=UPI0025498B79|nr:uncharacterized protein N7462_006536 [Penicillium macrosclerotiorum]KAJ5683371.1 hypothetical protein N7462_006536 [Penicillium macrosclerotiorum]